MTFDPAPVLALFPNLTRAQIAAECGVHPRMVARWRAGEARLTDHAADRLAVRLGYHPSQLWPEWFDTGLTPLDHDYLAGGWRRAWLWQLQHDEEIVA